MAEPSVVVGLGEVLWDMLPSGKVLGGAPANFAYMMNVLGERGIVASRIGIDDLGRQALEAMQRLGLDTTYVQHDDRHETGTANVAIDVVGQPNFTIKEVVAWDYLQWTPQWEHLAVEADVICFGSLAQRSPVSSATIHSFLANAHRDALVVFDINLRQSFYNRDVLCRSFERADIVKINDQELYQVAFAFELGVGDEATIARRLLREFNLELVCLTRGARGSLLVSAEEIVDHKGFRIKVADAVGAGDAFTACLVYYYLRKHSLGEISESANRFASWVATQTGATPPISPIQLEQILRGSSDSGESHEQSTGFTQS